MRFLPKKIWIPPLAVLLVGAFFFWPASTRMSVDFKFQETRVPLGLKTLDFFRRHRALARLTESLVEERDPPLERLLSLFQWTVDRIAPQPEEEPVLDDHILAIIERGYGVREQSADVFTTLSVYAGFPAAMVLVGPPGFQKITLSLVQVGEDYFLFDTERRNYFPGPDGRPASLRALQKDPRLAQKGLTSLSSRGSNTPPTLKAWASFPVLTRHCGGTFRSPGDGCSMK